MLVVVLFEIVLVVEFVGGVGLYEYVVVVVVGVELFCFVFVCDDLFVDIVYVLLVKGVVVELVVVVLVVDYWVYWYGGFECWVWVD